VPHGRVLASYLSLTSGSRLRSVRSASRSPTISCPSAFVVAAIGSARRLLGCNGLQQRATANERGHSRARVAQATSENRAAFLASMTHNLRTPLRHQKLRSLRLLDAPDCPTDRRLQLLRGARSEADRLDRFGHQVLELARIHAGALQPVREAVDLCESRTSRPSSRRARQRTGCGVAVIGDYVAATVDPDMTELVVIILVENALRFATRAFSSRPRDGSGRGRPLGCASSIMDPGSCSSVAPSSSMNSSGSTRRVRPRGSGLGLAIARSIVEAHSGASASRRLPVAVRRSS